MILSHEKILEAVRGKKLIENFSPHCLGGAGYDLRVGKVYRLESNGFIGKKEQKNSLVKEKINTENYVVLKPGEYILVETLEKVNMPLNLLARILPRSSLFRMGCSLITAVVDPGFKGTLTMGLKNLSEKSFTFQEGARIAQMIFEEVSGKTKGYTGRYQGGRII
jgi:deoxycytidine triphosphate deaminase